MNTNKFGFLKNEFSSEEKQANDTENQQLPTPTPPQKNSSSNRGSSSSKTAKKAATSTTKAKRTQSRQKLESSSQSKTTKKSPRPEPTSTNAESEEKIGKRSDPNYKTVGILLPKQAHKKAKILLMDDERERDFSALMGELLEKWLEKPDC